LKKASEYMTKARSPQKEELLAALNQRIYHMEQFVSARSKAKTQPEEMVKTCHQLLEQRDVETAIRVGDCFALLVEFYHSHKNYEAAFKLLQDMRQRQIVLNPYLEAEIIDEIHSHVGAGPAPERQAERISVGGGGGGGGMGRHHEEEEEEEELAEEFEEEDVAEMDSDNEYGGK
jgi:intraflagellar transport protein 140